MAEFVTGLHSSPRLFVEPFTESHWREGLITKISSPFRFTCHQRGLVGLCPFIPVTPPMKSQTSPRRSPDYFDDPHSSFQKPMRLPGRTPAWARRFVPSFSGSAANAVPAGRRGGRQRFGRPFHFLVFLSLSCCALFGIRRTADECGMTDDEC